MDRTFPVACITRVPTSVRKALAPALQLPIVSKPIGWTIKRFSKHDPYVDFDFPRHLLLLQIVSSERPEIKAIVQAFERISKLEGHTGSLFDVIMERLERHAARLEELVRLRTADLVLERERCDSP